MGFSKFHGGFRPPFPFEPGKPGPGEGEALDPETALQIIYELDNPE